RDRAREKKSRPAVAFTRGMDFGLFMWGNDDAEGRDKYKLMLEGAKFFDEHGFSSVWTPERHFHAFGGPYPNPSVTGAAIAAITKNISVRSGSCVSPLHHPVRIAEEWAVVDNLTNGRVALSFASGWQPNDFVLRPENFKNAKQVMVEQIEVVRKLWRGEAVEFENPMGQMVPIRSLPRPVQKELPIWVTTAGNPETYRVAGRTGANVLTHLLGQDVSEVAEKIAIYRKAREEAGYDPKAGIVTLMLHTFVGNDRDEVREIVRQPLKDYLGSSVALVKGFAWAFPAFKRPKGEEAKPADIDLSTLSKEELDAILDFAFNRYFEDSGLFGTIDECLATVDKLKAHDVDEIACLLDFGVPTDAIMENLPKIAELKHLANEVAPPDQEDYSFAAMVRRHEVTHMQCTPSMARMLLMNDENRAALSQVQHMMVGGEAFPPELAQSLAGLIPGSVTNMYGPTETTIWSATQRVEKTDGPPVAVPIGTPIANTQLYVLDSHRQPVPIGVAGELYIGGLGVARGYLERPALTDQRFVPNPFTDDASKMYRTGDLVRWRADGVVEFLGRIDHQVKIRGYRIELGEIEARIVEDDAIRECVCIVREDVAGDQRLVAYLVSAQGVIDTAAVKERCKKLLPEFMVPSAVVTLPRMPLTANGKVDRKQLPPPEKVASSRPKTEHVAPTSDLENQLVDVWKETLGVEQVGVEDNFFDIGGHSLLVVRMHRRLQEVVPSPVSLTDLFRFPTIRSFSNFLADGSSETVQQAADRGNKRLEMMKRRRRSRA
ncbi:MAG: MupA/Atu3671 family FMN-dependent luciferase-like monooxygenase, partial [Myxococcota bacterium]